MKKTLNELKKQALRRTKKAGDKVKKTADSVRRTRATKYILIIAAAIILPGGIILGPMALGRELNKDRKQSKKASKDEDSGTTDSSFFISSNP